MVKAIIDNLIYFIKIFFVLFNVTDYNTLTSIFNTHTHTHTPFFGKFLSNL